jgi:hypothetical protein
VNPVRVAVNLVAYQCAWLACVLGMAQQRPVLGLAVALATVLIHLHAAKAPRRELALVGVAVALGLVFESGLLASGWVRMQAPLPNAGNLPVLMVVLWGAFATTLNVALRPMRHRYLACAALAAVGAPLAYVAGARLGAIEWVEALPALLAISIGWAVLLPLLMRVAQRLDGFRA